jgi:hypothetical protein
MATCDVTQLLADGRCFMCLNQKQADAVLAQLLCEMVTAAANPEVPCTDLFIDDFDGPDGAELEPPWIKNGDTFLYDAGTAIEDPGGDGSRAWAPCVYVDGYVQAACLGTSYHQIFLRYDLVVPVTWYGARLNEATNQISLMKGNTVLATVSATFVAGHVLRLEAAGAQLTVIYNGVTVLVMTDTSSPILTAGYSGMTGSEDLGAIFDNFECCSND